MNFVNTNSNVTSLGKNDNQQATDLMTECNNKSVDKKHPEFISRVSADTKMKTIIYY